MIQAQLQEMQAFSKQTAAPAKEEPRQAAASPLRRGKGSKGAKEQPAVAADATRGTSETFAAVLAEQQAGLQAQLRKAVTEGREDDARAIQASLTELEAFARQREA